MSPDVLMIEHGCSDCAVLRAILDYSKIMEPDFRGKSGQELHIVVTLTPAASLAVFKHYGVSAEYNPVMLTYDGKVLEDVNEIKAYLIDQGYAVE